MSKLTERLERAIERELHRALFGETTTNTTTSESTLDLKKELPKWEQTIRNSKRSQVTIIADRAHEGSPIAYDTPDEGTVCEVSYEDAVTLHEQTPLKLHRVLSVDAAEFVPAIPYIDLYIPRELPSPPYELPPDESLEDWLAPP